MYGLWLRKKYLGAHNFAMFVFFPILLQYYMVIHSSHALGIAWISASREIFKKYLTFECFCFAIFFFPHYGNSLSPFWGKCIPIVRKEYWEKKQIFCGFASILQHNPHDEYDEECTCKAPKIKIMKNTALQKLG